MKKLGKNDNIDTKDILSSIDQIVVLLYKGRKNEAVKRISGLLKDILGLVRNSVDSVQKKETISNILNNIISALERGDYVFVCDLLKHGLKPEIANL